MFRLWLVSKGQGFSGFMFDVRVGEGQILISSDGEPYSRMWYELTKKRIDVLGFRDNETWLIEIKRKLNLMVIGQMDLYTSLLWETAFPDGPLVRAVITSALDPDIVPIMKNKSIEIFLVPDPHL